MSVVTLNGCFDGLHSGHLFAIGFARAQADELVVGINSDNYVWRFKGRIPISAKERMAALLDLGCVSRVVVFNENDPCEFIRQVHPDVHCTGEEYRGRAVEEKICLEMGIRLVYVPRVGKWSSTALRGGV